MIFKAYELEKVNLKEIKYFLLYGENQGHKSEIIEKKFKSNFPESFNSYEEKEILDNRENFFNEILTKSFFEKEKLIIINRSTDKLKDLIEEIIERKLDDLTFVLNSNMLEKKSKLRSFFEKNKQTACVPFYEDNMQTLSTIVNQFFRGLKIPIAQQAINLIVQRCRGDRKNLKNELRKIESFLTNKNKVKIDDLLKLTNLAENYNISELIDSCLSKNKRKTVNILNENNYSLEDCIIIIRTFLMKSKRLLKLTQELRVKKNIEEIISTFKPPIFWKDKEVVKQQIASWSPNNVESLIYKTCEIELLMKKNSSNSINILSNFIIEQASLTSN
jgi:DNA polymerase-3 subunit delta